MSDGDVSGVFVRRTNVYAEEFVSTHPQDRAYLAAEATAFLVFVLSQTRARVATPVCDGGLGEDAMRPERWMAVAAGLGIPVAPLRMGSDPAVRVQVGETTAVEVVDGVAYGDAPKACGDSAVRLAGALGLPWGVFVFDAALRIMTLSLTQVPGARALPALGALLGESA